ncbi:MAG: helix-turn-helix domain-containing protein [Bacteroidales bacterium]|nr:helix-turn-helix domain-containing protein [Bacteroidales bacterium]
MKTYLEVKNKKVVEAEELGKKSSTSLKRRQFYGSDLKLYNALVKWREDVAFGLEIPESRVIPTTTLQAIVEKKPLTIKDLKALSKVGSTRIQRFGSDILNIILEHQGMSRMDFDDEESKIELDLKDTVLRTKELMDEGLTLEEIADRRGMVLSTIQGHVAEMILKGYASAKDFMTEEHYDNIVEYFTETQDAALGAAHDVLGDDYTFGELRMVLSEMKRLGDFK